MIADYLVDEYGRTFEAWKDDITDKIDYLSMDVPYTEASIGFNLSGKDMTINSWKTKSYIKIKDVDKKLNYSMGWGYNKEGLYINESWGGGKDTLPLELPNGVTIDSHAKIIWSISKDETIVPWDTILECVRIAALASIAIALAPETGGWSLGLLCGA